MRNSSMESLTAEFEGLDVLVPNSGSLRDLIVDTLISLEAQQETLKPDVLRHLCCAYRTARPQEDRLLQGEEAKAVFRAAAIRSFHAHSPEESQPDRMVPQWPPGLPLDLPLPHTLVRYAGFVLGYRTAENNAKWLAHLIRSTGGVVS